MEKKGHKKEAGSSLWQVFFETGRSAVGFLGLISVIFILITNLSQAGQVENPQGSQPPTFSEQTIKTIIVQDYYPYTFVNEKGIPDGFSVDLAKAVAQVMGLKLEISVDTWAQATKALINGTIDFLPMMAASPERRQLYDFSAPHTIGYDAVFVRKGANKLKSIKDLSEKSVIVMNKDAAHDYLLSSGLVNKRKLILVNSLPDALRILASNQGEAALMPKLVGLIMMKKLALPNLEPSPVVIDAYSRPFSFAVKKGNQVLLERLSQGLSIIKTTGQYDDIYKKWFGALEPPVLTWRASLKYIAGTAAGFTLFGLALLLWTVLLRKQVAWRTRSLEAEILERKKVETALQESKENLNILLHRIQAAVIVHDSETKIITVNSCAQELFGLKEDQMLGKAAIDPIWKFLRPDGSTMPLEEYPINRVLTTRQPLREYIFGIYRSEKGDTVWVLVSADLIFDIKDEINQVIVTFMDITEQKRGVEALQNSESFLSSIIDQSPHPMWISDVQGTLIRLNQACRDLLNISDDDVVGKYNILKDNIVDEQGFLPFVKRVFEEGETARFEIRYDSSLLKHLQLSHFAFVILDVHVFPIRDARGRITNAVIQHTNITERKGAEEALHQERNLLARIMETSPVGIVKVDREGRITFANNRAEEILGLSKDEITSRTYNAPVWKVTDYAGEPLADEEFPFRRVMDSGQAVFDVPQAIEWPDGQRVLLSINAAPLFNESGELEGMVATLENVTERKRAEEALNKSEEKFRKIFYTSPEIMSINRLDNGLFVSINPGLTRIMGYTEKDIIGKTSIEYTIWDNIEDRQRLISGLEKEGEVTNLEAAFRTKGGEILYGLVSASIINLDGVPHIIFVTRDITDRKRAEEKIRQLNIELEQRVIERTAELEAKNRELESFTYSVSHDLKAPLRGIDGYSRLLAEDYGGRLDEDGRLFLNNVLISVTQMNQLIEDLLAYSRLERRSLTKGKIQVEPFVKKLINERQDDILRRNIQLKINVTCDDLETDQEGLRQVIRNLLDNALKFIRNTDKPAIEIGGRESEKGCLLWIKDNGIGFDMKYMDRIFQIFQRLERSENFPGTGIGLAIVRKVMERIGGRAWAESEPGKGAAFFIEIPKKEV